MTSDDPLKDYELREFRPADEDSLLRNMNATFALESEHHVDRGVEEWRHVYLRNPAGLRLFVAEHRPSGEIVAQFPGWPQRADWNGDLKYFVHLGDTFVAPEHRWGKGKSSLFTELAAAFFDYYGTSGGPDRDGVHYGMPTVRHWRLARYDNDRLSYDILRPHGMLGRLPEPAEMPAEVERINRFDEQAHWLFERCAEHWGFAAIRDDSYLNWRLIDHPTRDYECLGVRDASGILRGTAVVRKMDFILPNLLVVVDWMVPPAEPEVGELLHRALMARANDLGVNGLTVLFNEWSPWFEDFQSRGWTFHPTPYFMVCRSFYRNVDLLDLKDGWWYQLSDLDLV